MRRDARNLLGVVTAHNRTQLRWIVGLRSGVGVALPLLVGALSGEVSHAIVVAVGALVAGFGSSAATPHTRLRTMILATLWMSIATWFATITGSSLALTLVVCVISGFASGMMVAVSPTAAQVGLLATDAMVIFAAFPAGAAGATQQMLLVLLGGSLQVALLIVHDRIWPEACERQSVVDVLQRLARFGRERSRRDELLVVQALLAAEAQIGDSRRAASARDFWLDVLEQVERVRQYLSTLLLSERIVRSETGRAPAWDDAFATVAERCERLAHAYQMVAPHGPAAVADGRAEREQGPSFEQEPSLALNQPLFDAVGAPTDAATREAMRQFADLSAALVRLEGLAHGTAPTARHSVAKMATFWPPMRTLLATVRANLTLRSSACRHALRLAIALGIAVALYRGIPLARGYWVPMTALLVLKPDYASTFGRGLARIAGTLIGVIAATGLVLIPDPSHAFNLLWIVLLGAGMYAVINFNYALFSAFVTAEIVILLSFFEHVAPLAAAADRTLDTIVGSALALLIFMFFPTWQRSSLTTVLADFMAANRRYLCSILALIAGDRNAPAASAICADSPASTSQARTAIRLARANAVAVIEQAQSEPGARAATLQPAVALLMTLHRSVDALVSLEAHIQRQKLPPGSLTSSADDDSALGFCEQLAGVYAELEAHLRAPHPPEFTSDAAPVHAHTLRLVADQSQRSWDDDYLRVLSGRLARNAASLARLS